MLLFILLSSDRFSHSMEKIKIFSYRFPSFWGFGMGTGTVFFGILKSQKRGSAANQRNKMDRFYFYYTINTGKIQYGITASASRIYTERGRTPW